MRDFRFEISDFKFLKPLGNLFEQLPQILKHGVFFVRLRAVSEKELMAEV